MSYLDEEIASWLRDSITVRLALARAATQVPWEAEGDDPADDEVWIDVDGEEWRMVICRGPQSHENMLHIAANDPRTVIARCEADLRMLDTFGSLALRSESYADMLLRELAWGWRYADGYKQEWAPEA